MGCSWLKTAWRCSSWVTGPHRGRWLGRGRSLPLTRPPSVDFFRESRSPPEPTCPHHAGTTPHRRRRPPSSPACQEEMLRGAPAAPASRLRPPPQWNRLPRPRPAMVDTKDGEMPCHAVHPHHDASPGQDGRESQPLPGKRRCRLVTGGERPSRGTRRRPCLPERQRRLRRRPTTLLGSIRIPPPLLLQDITRPRNCRHPFWGSGSRPLWVAWRACLPHPLLFWNQDRARGKFTDATSARLRESWDFDLTMTIIEGRLRSIGPRTGSSVPVCPRASSTGAMRHMAIIRAHPRWSGRSHLATSPRPPLLVHCATSSSASPPSSVHSLAPRSHHRPRG